MSHSNSEALPELELYTKQVIEQDYKLVIYNDDVNTFDHVIENLVKICGHGATQAEQLAVIIHYKGKATVKAGPIEPLSKMCYRLLDKGISAKVE